MRREVKQKLATQISEYMFDYGLTFTSDNPFPVSWRTIWAIKSSANQKHNHYQVTFSREVQRKMLDFFDLDYIQDGNDYILK